MKKLLLILLLGLSAACANSQTLYINKYLRDSAIAGSWFLYHDSLHNGTWRLVGSGAGGGSSISLAGENYLSLAGSVLTANAVNLSGTNVTGTLAAGRFPALTGDVTTSAGSLVTSIGIGVIVNADVNASAAIAQSKIDGLQDSLENKNFKLGWYNVLDFGADSSGVSDSYQAIQNAIDTVDAHGGGVVYFPSGEYLTSRVIRFPLNSYANSENHKFIHLLGEVPPNMYSNPLTDVTTQRPPETGVRIRATFLGDSAVIATRYEAVSWGDFSFVGARIENIACIVRSKTGATHVAPQGGGIDGRKLAYLQLENVKVGTESAQDSTVQPTNTAYGIRFPVTNNFVFTNGNNVLVQGMYVGFDLYEHSSLTNIFVDFCYYGIAFNPGNHSIHIDKACVARSVYNIAVNGEVNFTIDNISFEDKTSGSEWWVNVLDLYEGVAGGTGTIRFNRVETNVGIDNNEFRRTTAPHNIVCLPLNENIPTWSVATRPTVMPTVGMMIGFNTDSSWMEYKLGANWYKLSQSVISSGGGGGGTPYLDGISTHSAFSLKKLYTAYAGSAVRIRRSSDNAEQDIGFDGSGDFDVTAFDAFIGGGSGFVRLWYDQSGNGKDVGSATAAEQPQLVTSTTSGKPGITFDGSNDQLVQSTSGQAQSFKAYGVVENVAVKGTNHTIVSGATGSGALSITATNRYLDIYGGTSITGSTTVSSGVVFGEFDGASSSGWVNGVQAPTGNAGTTGFVGGVAIGQYAQTSASYFQGTMFEVVVFSDNTYTDVSGLTTTINSYYGVF